jgi:hypothetical protein
MRPELSLSSELQNLMNELRKQDDRHRRFGA